MKRRYRLDRGGLPDLRAAITLLEAQAAQPAGVAQGCGNPEDGQGTGSGCCAGGEGKAASDGVGVGELEIDL